MPSPLPWTRCAAIALLVCGLATSAAAQRAGHATAGDGTRLYYEVSGEEHAEATPVVLVAGLGVAAWLWEQQVPALAEHFPAIAYDNRGVGRSDAPEGPYTAALLADDLASLLDALGVERAHLVGASLGGFIAQEFALRHPERVERLVLVSTSAGGASHVPMGPQALALLFATHDDPRELIRMRLPLAFTEAFLADETAVEHLIAQRLERPQPPHAYAAQAAAGASFDAAERVQAITAPTLVAHGTDDLLVPVANARNLAEALPCATLRLYEGLGHQFFVEAPPPFNRDLVAFLRGLPLPEAEYPPP
jgi:3-oxoadipate enol-lactonase